MKMVVNLKEQFQVVKSKVENKFPESFIAKRLNTLGEVLVGEKTLSDIYISRDNEILSIKIDGKDTMNFEYPEDVNVILNNFEVISRPISLELEINNSVLNVLNEMGRYTIIDGIIEDIKDLKDFGFEINPEYELKYENLDSTIWRHEVAFDLTAVRGLHSSLLISIAISDTNHDELVGMLFIKVPIGRMYKGATIKTYENEVVDESKVSAIKIIK